MCTLSKLHLLSKNILSSLIQFWRWTLKSKNNTILNFGIPTHRNKTLLQVTIFNDRKMHRRVRREPGDEREEMPRPTVSQLCWMSVCIPFLWCWRNLQVHDVSRISLIFCDKFLFPHIMHSIHRFIALMINWQHPTPPFILRTCKNRTHFQKIKHDVFWELPSFSVKSY